MKILIFFIVFAVLTAWLMGSKGHRQTLDSNGCHTSPRTGIYHCHTGEGSHPENGEPLVPVPMPPAESRAP